MLKLSVALALIAVFAAGYLLRGSTEHADGIEEPGPPELRISAMRHTDGRVEVAVQLRAAPSAEWSERIKPVERFLAPNAPTSRWLNSSPAPVPSFFPDDRYDDTDATPGDEGDDDRYDDTDATPGDEGDDDRYDDTDATPGDEGDDDRYDDTDATPGDEGQDDRYDDTDATPGDEGQDDRYDDTDVTPGGEGHDDRYGPAD